MESEYKFSVIFRPFAFSRQTLHGQAATDMNITIDSEIFRTLDGFSGDCTPADRFPAEAVESSTPQPTLSLQQTSICFCTESVFFAFSGARLKNYK